MELATITLGVGKHTAWRECCSWRLVLASSCGPRSKQCRWLDTGAPNRWDAITIALGRQPVAFEVEQEPSPNQSSLFKESCPISQTVWDCKGEIKVTSRLTSSAYKSNSKVNGLYDDVATELKEIRQAQAVVLGTLRQLMSKFQPKAKRQRVAPVHTERGVKSQSKVLESTVRTRGGTFGVDGKADESCDDKRCKNCTVKDKPGQLSV